MKFVYNEERNEKMRHILMMQPKADEAQAKVDADVMNPAAWYELGTALALETKYDESIDAYSRGVITDPFYAPNYFGRGRRYNITGRFWQAMADFSIAIHLDPDNWTYWYYRATTENLAGYLEESLEDFKMCLKFTHPKEHYPLINWLFNTNVELGRFDEADKSLELIDATVKEPQMDYGYARCVRLFKGMIPPEEFIDIEGMKKAVLPRERRVELELNGMYYGLYNYWKRRGQMDKARQALVDLQKVVFPGAFGHTKSLPFAREMGIID